MKQKAQTSRKENLASRATAQAKHGTFTYMRDRDGTFDEFVICNPAGKVIASLYFWDEPDTDECFRAHSSAHLIVEHLNRWRFDGWKEVFARKSRRKRRKERRNASRRKR